MRNTLALGVLVALILDGAGCNPFLDRLAHSRGESTMLNGPECPPRVCGSSSKQPRSVSYAGTYSTLTCIHISSRPVAQTAGSTSCAACASACGIALPVTASYLAGSASSLQSRSTHSCV